MVGTFLRRALSSGVLATGNGFFFMHCNIDEKYGKLIIQQSVLKVSACLYI